MNKIISLLETIFKFVSDVLFLFLISYGLICVPMLFGYKFFMPLTDNADLSFDRGTLVYYESVSEKQIQEEDIVVTGSSNNQYEIFRIYGIVKENDENGEEKINYFTTSSQGNGEIDSLYPNDILGRVLKVRIPYLGYYAMFINTHLFLIYLSLGLIVLDWLFGSYFTSAKEKRRAINR